MIRRILASRVGPENSGIGMVVGVIDPNGRRVISYGSLAKNDKRPLNGDTIFEIGSMTKVFTSLVLMDMANEGEVAVTDPLSKYLPANVTVPERNGRKITLQDLSTHSSGLPGSPTNIAPKDMANPYADYSLQQLYQFLSGYRLPRDIEAQHEYSNLGAGLLQIAYAWRIQTKDGNFIIWHSGGTGGYRTFMGFDPKTRTGVVVLSNLGSSNGDNDIGRHLLDAGYPLEKAGPAQ